MTKPVASTLAKLRSIVAQLRDDAEAVNPHIEPELALFIADAFDTYLRAQDAGRPITLDASFGLKKGRGRPPEPASQEDLDIVEKAFWLLTKGATWEEAAAEADPKEVMEESNLRKKLKRRLPEVQARMAKRIADSLNKTQAARKQKSGP